MLLAPFYFKLGDSIATFIELNTDEFGNVKPLDDSESSAEESQDEEEPVDPREESKDEPRITTDEVQINTTSVPKQADGDSSADEGNQAPTEELH